MNISVFFYGYAYPYYFWKNYGVTHLGMYVVYMSASGNAFLYYRGIFYFAQGWVNTAKGAISNP